MADATPENAAAQRAAEQARLRKERLEAKVRAGGSVRLNRITSSNSGSPVAGAQTGSPAPPYPSDSTPPPKTSPSKPTESQSTTAHDDPEEVDISGGQFSSHPRPSQNVFSTPQPSVSEDQLRQMMLGFDRPANTPPQANPFAAPGQAQDPFSQLLSQMMAGANGPGAGAGGFPGMPPFGQQQTQTQQQQPGSRLASIWSILHAIFALGLGLYVAFATPFTGAKIDRELAEAAYKTDGIQDDDGRHRFFWIFASTEAILLTTRLFIDSGNASLPGALGTVMNFIPQPFNGYISVLLRYSQIFMTVRSDLLACVFVLGVCSWVRGF